MSKVKNALRNSKVSAALSYAKRGWAVVPLYTVKDGQCTCAKGASCKRPGKHPMTKHGVKDATTKLKPIKKWWKDSPDANIGVATGTVSGIMVLDLDPRNDGNETLKEAQKKLGKLPKTVTTITGGNGKHYIFAHPKKTLRSDTAGKLLGRGLDVLSNGHYFVAPGSVGLKRKYVWVTGKTKNDLDPAELPPAWLKCLRPKKKKSADKKPAAAGAINEGSRNTELTSMAGTLRYAGLGEDAIAAALLAHNSKTCHPPLDEHEVRSIAASVACYVAGPTGVSPDPALNVVNQVLDKHFHGGQYLRLEQGRFWVYDATHWLQAPHDWIRKQILMVVEQTGVSGRNASSLLKQCFDLLRARLAERDDQLGYVKDPKPVINTLNGEVWIADDGSVELRPHRPDSFLRHCLDIVYDPSATCPNYDSALKGIFSKAKKPNGMVRHWNELFGYILQPRRTIPLVVIAIGGGANGKTVLMRTVQRLLGPQLIVALAIGNFKDNRFAMGSLFGKQLLLDDDVEDGARLPDGFLKTVSEEKIVTGEDKYLPAYNFKARVVPVLLCNNAPSVSDLTHGMRRRLMIIPFDKTFSDEEKDDTLFDKIWATELPGVLNRAIEGLQRLRARKKFSEPADLVRAKAEYLGDANPLAAFMEECTARKASTNVYIADLYRTYLAWCDDSGVTRKQQRKKFRHNLKSLGYAESRDSNGWKLLGISIT